MIKGRNTLLEGLHTQILTWMGSIPHFLATAMRSFEFNTLFLKNTCFKNLVVSFEIRSSFLIWVRILGLESGWELNWAVFSSTDEFDLVSRSILLLLSLELAVQTLKLACIDSKSNLFLPLGILVLSMYYWLLVKNYLKFLVMEM